MRCLPCIRTMIESGLLAAMALANSKAFASTWSSGTTALRRPSCNASCAGMLRPVSSSSAAKDAQILEVSVVTCVKSTIPSYLPLVWPTSLTKRGIPPAPTVTPRLASGKPRVALSPATARSRFTTISAPPPIAKPLMAPMMGFLKFCQLLSWPSSHKPN